ncbi:tetratricopeptide repeat protein [Roseovarius aestuarii]|uniref:Tetratricopeptide repeat protein n=1 Tax=Roseovarius aestuarii TaxID=475083 RepID=A0A1X7BWR5_9RHOB|nr:tetratricopeptide repeat protein [Roseovarius aestuarii]SMC13945.1 Tetratricopeptide repeat protein [Roseovarius aestuarii]
MRLVTGIAATFAFVLALLIGGTDPFGRVVLSLGMPQTAAALLQTPDWQGVALYRAGNYTAAAEAFDSAGPAALYNRGNALAQAGQYAAALEAYDLALAIREDPQARANFDLLRAFYAGTALEADTVFLSEKREGETVRAPVARGDARAAGTGDEVTNTGATLALPSLQSDEQLGVRRVFDDVFIVANDRWLKTLEDVPGAFLAARIAHEHKARRKAGTGQIPQETEW